MIWGTFISLVCPGMFQGTFISPSVQVCSGVPLFLWSFQLCSRVPLFFPLSRYVPGYLYFSGLSRYVLGYLYFSTCPGMFWGTFIFPSVQVCSGVPLFLPSVQVCSGVPLFLPLSRYVLGCLYFSVCPGMFRGTCWSASSPSGSMAVSTGTRPSACSTSVAATAPSSSRSARPSQGLTPCRFGPLIARLYMCL